MSISDNIANIQEQISQAAKACGRSPEEITLIAVSKTRTLDEVLAAHSAGLLQFGENRVQEIREKFDPSPKDDIVLHMIGHLQSNKTNHAVRCASWIHSVDSEKILRKISLAAVQSGKILNICLEKNTSGEESKYGLVDTDEILQLAELAMELPGVRLRGLMTVGPLMSAGEGPVQRAFAGLRDDFDLVASMLQPKAWDTLSMGMSNDFPLAISEGATMVRIGTALFGARDYGAV